MPRTGRAKGTYAVNTVRQAARIRQLRDRYTLTQIGEKLGITRTRVWQICRAFGITSPRDNGPRPKAKVPRRNYYPVPPVDPAKAEAITAQKRAYWESAA